jgi:hypothetical protein
VVYVIKNYDVKLTKAQKEIFAEVLPCKKIDNKAIDNISNDKNIFQHNFHYQDNKEYEYKDYNYNT